MTKRQFYDFGEPNQTKERVLAARETAIFIDLLCIKIVVDHEKVKYNEFFLQIGMSTDYIILIRRIA